MRIIACLFVLTVVGFASATPVRAVPAKAKSDLDLIQGDWTIASFVKDNYENPQGDKVTYTFRENEVFIHIEQVNAPAFDEKATFKIDSTKTPKQIDIVPPDLNGGKERFIFKGIYELEGNTLRICKAIPGEIRPTEFTTKIGIMTLRCKIP